MKFNQKDVSQSNDRSTAFKYLFRRVKFVYLFSELPVDPSTFELSFIF